MYVVGKALDSLFLVCFIGKKRFVLFACFCPCSKMRLCARDPEAAEADNPSDWCEFWITPSMSQSWINQVIWHLKSWHADLDGSNFPSEAFFSFMSFYSIKMAEYLILRWMDFSVLPRVRSNCNGHTTLYESESFSASHSQSTVTYPSCQVATPALQGAEHLGVNSGKHLIMELMTLKRLV